MKKYLVVLGLMLVLFIVGCTAGQPAVPANEPTPAPEPTVVPEPTPVPEVPQAMTGEIQVLGKQGFDQTEVKIKAGDSVMFVNNDPSELSGNKDVMLIVSTASGKNLASELVAYHDSFEYMFSESGSYKVLSVTSGTTVDVVVE